MEADVWMVVETLKGGRPGGSTVFLQRLANAIDMADAMSEREETAQALVARRWTAQCAYVGQPHHRETRAPNWPHGVD